MIAVTYDVRMPYVWNNTGRRCPGLVIQLGNPSDGSMRLDTSAELDSGAEYSLFDGAIAASVGLELSNGQPFSFRLMDGSPLDARILSVLLFHPDLGEFAIDLRFSLNPVQRNVLGRDFFSRVQVGFREYHLETYLASTP